MSLRTCFLLLIFGMGSALAQPQLGPFHNLGVKEGLSQSLVAFMYCDSRGFMWLSSADGLNHFDGQKVSVYRPNASDKHAIVGNNIQSNFFEDISSGDLWFSTWEAINNYRRKHNDFDHYHLLNPQGKPYTSGYHIVHREENGWLWVQIEDETVDEGGILFRFNPKTKEQIEIGRMGGIRFKVDTTANGQVNRIVSWHITGKTGIEILTPNKNSKTWTRNLFFEKGNTRQFPPLFVYACLIEKDEQLWLATNNGIVCFDLNNETHQIFWPDNISDKHSFSDLVAADRRYLICSTRGLGLFIFDKNTKKFIRQLLPSAKKANGLADIRNDNLYLDPNRTLWVSQWTNGVQFANLDKPKIRNLPIEEPTGNGKKASFFIQSLVQDHTGHIWCATDQGQIYRINPTTLEKREVAFPAPFLTRLATDLNGHVWALTQKNLYQYNEQRKAFEAIAIDDSDFKGEYRCLLQQKDGTILVGSYYGLFELQPQKSGRYKLIKTSTFADITTAEHLFEDSKGQLWIDADYKQLQCWKAGKRLVTYEITESKSFFELPNESTLLVATNIGLAVIDLNNLQCRYIDESKGLPNQYLSGVAMDSKGDVWISSNQGIVRYNLKSGKSWNLNQYDGVWADEFFPETTLKLSNGEIWMGNRQVINILHPKDLNQSPRLATIQLIGIHVNDAVASIKGGISELLSLQFPHDSSTLTFRFAALDFSDPNAVQYKCLLEGYDRDTLHIKRGETGSARYPQLPSGNYTFKVWAANSDGVWNPNPREVKLTIHPAWYQTWWFRLLVLAGLLTLVWWMIQQRTQRLLAKQRTDIEKEQALIRERQRIARDMHDDLGSGLSALQMMSNMTKNKTTDPALRSEMEKIVDSSAQLNQNIREIIWTVHTSDDKLSALIYFLRRYCADFEELTQIDVRLNVEEPLLDRQLSSEQRRNIFLCVKEAMNNTAKYAAATQIQLHINAKSAQIEMSISDNGKGFDVAAAFARAGNGLQNIVSRMQDIGGTATIESEPGKTQVYIKC